MEADIDMELNKLEQTLEKAASLNAFEQRRSQVAADYRKFIDQRLFHPSQA
jgi:hypothetical protein